MDSTDFNLIRPIQGPNPAADVGGQERRQKRRPRETPSSDKDQPAEAANDVVEIDTPRHESVAADEDSQSIDFRA